MYNFLVLTSRHNVGALTYSYSLELEIGTIVSVSIKNSEVAGIILEKLDNPNFNYKVKNISKVFEGLVIKPPLIKFIKELAKYYIIDESSLCKMMLSISFKNIDIARKIQQDFHYSIPSLSSAQIEALEKLQQNTKPCLLHGVTGSGKTEIYFHLIKNILTENGQVLLMLPEIGLVRHIEERFRRAFGVKAYLWHSGISSAKKRDIFCGVLNGSCKIVIGTRSSLFLPFQNLKLILVDEEHDGSYKQEEGSLYNARDAAILRASIERIKIVLISATPSLETYENARSGKYNYVQLTERFNKASLPKIHIVDMKQQERGNWISSPLRKAITEALYNKKQIILFINRKGYAPLMLCSKCGFRFGCNNCSSWLVYHKEKAMLICHYCGYNINYHDKCRDGACPDCNEKALIPCGPGVERVAAEAEEVFSGAKIAKFARDYEDDSEDINIIQKIQNREIDIIVGTQILTKGYHFPHVTVVGIIDGDTGLANLDLKATERSFQVLHQVSGRAGREIDKGQSFIQTYLPENHLFADITSHSQDFYEKENIARKEAGLPPFFRIIAIIVCSDIEAIALKYAKELRYMAPKTERVRILGPAPATLSKLRGKYRFRILLIADKNFNLQFYTLSIMEKLKLPPKMQIRVEVDPYSFY
ncbi:MAG: primosomal protein N' [Rickettsiaceae bacterium]|nr:primosomal protein N' [Rickettsiaceae bacterium]